jgi:menaquinone-specific isochorismate synthase
VTAAVVTTRSARENNEPIDSFVRWALDDAIRARAIAVIRVPAPCAPYDRPLRTLRKSTSISWRGPDGAPISGIGRAAEISAHGAERFDQLRTAIDAVFSRVRSYAHSSVSAAPPRLYGGCAFAPSSADTAPWIAFGDARFVLPRFSYDGSVITAAVDLAHDGHARAAFLEHELATMFGALETEPRSSTHASIVARRGVDHEQYATLVRSIVTAIEGGHLEKAVASRNLALFTDHDLDPWQVLAALSARYPSTHCFGIRFGTTTFVGASPERLFEKRGSRVTADALAGSIAAGAPDASLLMSQKDRREHRPVVAHVLERLAPICDRLEPPGEPSIRRLPNVSHLHTSLRGVLRDGIGAIDVLRALHPTPAICGVPSDAALAHILTHEPHARGWYCGPVGWIDADGDAELAVALRCGILRGSSAWLYAGGGIVEGSEPDAEWAETELKLRPLIEAIGAS